MGPSITSILRRILAAGLIAGFVAGTAVTAVQMLQVTPLILAAETYEGAADHQHSHDQANHDRGSHDHGTTPGAPDEAATDETVAEAWAPDDGIERTAFTWLANILTGVGFGLVLAAAMGFTDRPVDWRRGLVWGLAGYGAFAVAPALGLPPELPGMVAADLAARQIWWLLAAGGTAGGLALLVFAPGQTAKRPLQVLGLALILLPHLFGAPHPASGSSAVPAELAARFVVASLAASAMFWAVLGMTVGHFMARVMPGPGIWPRGQANYA